MSSEKDILSSLGLGSMFNNAVGSPSILKNGLQANMLLKGLTSKYNDEMNRCEILDQIKNLN